MSEAPTQNGSSNGHSSMPSTARLTTTPFAASRKVHVDGSLPGVRVPMREISLTPTHSANGKGETPNQPVTVYDTSGPYTDPNITIDVRAGLPPLRRAWIDSRQDVEELPQVTSQYGRLRAADPKLTDLRFEHIRKPLRAKAGQNVSQMHYAKRGIITPEMEFIAIRENQSRDRARDLMAATNGHGGGVVQHPGQAWGASIPNRITP